MADDEAEARGPTRRRTTAAAGGAKKIAAGGPAKSAPAKKSAAKKSAAKRSVAQPAATQAAPRKAMTRRTGATLVSGAHAGRVAPPTPPATRLAAEQTFDDDWDLPGAAPSTTDPSDRIRAALRSAAAEIRAREAGPGAIPGYPVPPAEPVDAPEPVPEIVIGPARRGPLRRAATWDPAPAPVVTTPEAPEPGPEPQVEWRTEDQPFDEEPTIDRIPDAMDVLTVPGVASPRPPLTVTRRFPPPPRQPAPAATPPLAPPVADAEAPPTERPSWTPPPQEPPVADAAAAPTEPPAWTPPPSAPPKAGRSGGAGMSVLAIVLSIVVPVIGAVVGLVLATRARRRGLALAGLARVVAVVALVGWLAAGAVALVAARDQGIDYSKLEVGDCFDSSATNEVRGIDVNPCSKAHNSEVFFLVTHPAGPGEAYPGKDALVQFAADACLGQPLTDYLGIPLEQSTLKDFEIVPQESAWKDGRRLLVCGIDTGGEGRITGSVKGTSR